MRTMSVARLSLVRTLPAQMNVQPLDIAHVALDHVQVNGKVMVWRLLTFIKEHGARGGLGSLDFTDKTRAVFQWDSRCRTLIECDGYRDLVLVSSTVKYAAAHLFPAWVNTDDHMQYPDYSLKVVLSFLKPLYGGCYDS